MTKQSPRLSNDNRPIILKAVITNQLQPEFTAICGDGALLAHEYYLHLIPKEIRDLAPGICGEYEKYQVKVGDDVDEIHFNGQFLVRENMRYHTSYDWFIKPEARRFPFPHNKAHGVIAILEANSNVDKFYKQFKANRERQEAFNKKFFELQKEIAALLYSFTTVKTLVEAWPEVEPFIPQNISLPKLPALPIAALNEKLGLP